MGLEVPGSGPTMQQGFFFIMHSALPQNPKRRVVLHVLQRGYKAVGFGKAGLNRFCLLLATTGGKHLKTCTKLTL